MEVSHHPNGEKKSKNIFGILNDIFAATTGFIAENVPENILEEKYGCHSRLSNK